MQPTAKLSRHVSVIDLHRRADEQITSQRTQVEIQTLLCSDLELGRGRKVRRWGPNR